MSVLLVAIITAGVTLVRLSHDDAPTWRRRERRADQDRLDITNGRDLAILVAAVVLFVVFGALALGARLTY